MFRYAIKNIWAHKLRVVLTSIAIALGVSFVSGTYIFTDTISKSFDGLFTEVFSGIDLTVEKNEQRESIFPSGMALDTVDKISENPDVQKAVPRLVGTAVLIDKDGQPIVTGGAPTFGFSWIDDEQMNPLTLEDGKAPEAKNEVAIDKLTADQKGFKIGEKIRISSQGAAEEFDLVGLVSFGQFGGTTIATFTLEEADELFDANGTISAVFLRANQGVDLDELQADIESDLGEDFLVKKSEDQAADTKANIDEGLDFINSILLGFAGIAVIVGGFIIYNTFRIVVAQRSRDLALLRAIGATKSQVMRSVVYEAAIIGFISSLIGMGLGVLLSKGIIAIANQADVGLPGGSTELASRTVIVSLGVGMFVTILSALVPAIKASKAPPVAALKSSDYSAMSNKYTILQWLKRRSKGKSAGFKNLHTGHIFAFFLALLGVLMIWRGLGYNGLQSPALWAGAGSFLVFIAGIMAISVFMPLFINTIGRIFSVGFGFSGKMALSNLRRSASRTSSAAAALMIGVSLISFSTVLVSSIKTSIDTFISESMPADVAVQGGQFGQGIVPRSFLDDAESLGAVEVVTGVLYEEVYSADLDQAPFMAFVDFESFGEVVTLKPSVETSGLTKNQIIIKDDLASEAGLSVGDKLDFDDLGQLEIAGTFENNYDAKYVASHDLIPDADYVAAFINFTDDTDATEARAELDDLGKQYPTLTIQDQSELVGDAEAQLDHVLTLFWALLGFAIFIAVIGIVITLVLSISERQREIALLRAVGTTRRQIKRMVRVESVMISIFGAAFGLLMGIFFAWVMLQVLRSEGLTDFTVPWTRMFVYILIAVAAGILSSILPSRIAAKTNILSAIKSE